MTRCSVSYCTNTYKNSRYKKLKFYRFPRNKHVQMKWIEACKPLKNFNIKNARVCSVHFTKSDKEVELKYRLLKIDTPVHRRNLRKDAVPSLLIDAPSGPTTTEGRL